MSVGVIILEPHFSDFEREFSIPISNEKFFQTYWESAIEELKLQWIQNGIEIKKENLQSLLFELDKLKEWAEINLTEANLIYMIERIHALKDLLPTAFQRESAIIWFG
jgi:hypothetical protein